MRAIGMVTWTRESSVLLPQAKEWVMAHIIHADSTTTREVFSRVGQQCGDGYFPPHLRGVPVVGAGGCSAGGHSWGMSWERFARGRTNRYVNESPDLLAAAERCWAALRLGTPVA